ncbi:hypothetical protein BsWGS_20279 [Bradybaena similaris]
MFWPAPEETLNNEEVVVCPSRKYIDQSFYIKRELESMESDVPNDGTHILEFSKPEPLRYSSGSSCCNVFYKTLSPQAARDQRHRQNSCHLEFPR